LNSELTSVKARIRELEKSTSLYKSRLNGQQSASDKRDQKADIRDQKVDWLQLQLTEMEVKFISITKDHESQLQELRAGMVVKDNTIGDLKRSVDCLTQSVNNLNEGAKKRDQDIAILSNLPKFLSRMANGEIDERKVSNWV